MRKLLIISFYKLIDFFLNIADNFNKFEWEVTHYPLFMYAYDQNSKIDNYQDHMIEFISKNTPHLILWWFIDVPIELFTKVKSTFPEIYLIMFNANDPLNMNRQLLRKASIFNLIFTSCQQNVEVYQTHTQAAIHFFPFGYDDSHFKPIKSIDTYDHEQHSCDISFICDNLYLDFRDQLYPRKKLIEDLITISIKKKWKFHLYGPSYLENKYPSIYRGDPSYEDRPLIFCLSKINIVTHATYKKKMYINEHLIPIAACGSTILVDKVRGFEDYFKSSVGYLGDNLGEIIEELLKSPKNCYEIIKKFSWTEFTKLVLIEYTRSRFDQAFYRNTWDYWLERLDSGSIDVPYQVAIPDNFDIENYKSQKHLEIDNQKIYQHWWSNGKNRDYLVRKKKESTVSGSSMNISTAGLLDAASAFNDIYVHHRVDKGLDKLVELADMNPRFDINSALITYLDLIIND